MVVIPQLCYRCAFAESQESKILQEIANSRNRSTQDLSRQVDKHESLKDRARDQQQKRLSERNKSLEKYEQHLKQREEELYNDAAESLNQGEEVDQIVEKILSDQVRQDLERKINSLKYQSEEVTYKDVEAALKELEKEGLISLDKEQVRITPKGARLLAAQALKKVMEKLAKHEVGSHVQKDKGYGSEVSLHSRKYEVGDQYELVDIEKTLANALERSGRISLKPEDFRVFDTIHQTRMCAGVVIDESGSMEGDYKIQAAINASLALSELIRRDPKDTLKVFVFSESVKEIPSWDIVNSVTSRGSTDIRAALRAFRKAVIHEKGDRQVYLITDSEPNTEEGVYVGFDRAMLGVLHEAQRYREYGITLNIIMLDQRPALKSFARTLAKKNLGRVLFATPTNLGEAIVEDYLRVKKEKSPY